MINNKILIIDDNQDILEAVKDLLEMEEYQVQTLDKGEDVLKVVEAYKPDLILLDLLLSGKDGGEICKQLKTNQHTCRIPVIITSAHPTAAISAKNAGADDFLSKPFEADTLFSLINKFTTVKSAV